MFVRIVAAAALLFAVLGCAVLGWCGRAASASGGAVVASITVREGKGAGAARQPFVDVRVGNGPSVPVLLDTGSVGLHLYSYAVRTGRRSGVVLSTKPDSIAYVDGTTQTGVVAHATVTIAGLKTSTPIAFGLIKTVGCMKAIPSCPTSRGLGA